MLIVTLAFLLLKVWMCFDSCSHVYSLFQPQSLVFLSGPRQQGRHTGSPLCVYTTLPSLYQLKSLPPLDWVYGGVLESMLIISEASERWIFLIKLIWQRIVPVSLLLGLVGEGGHVSITRKPLSLSMDAEEQISWQQETLRPFRSDTLAILRATSVWRLLCKRVKRRKRVCTISLAPRILSS